MYLSDSGLPSRGSPTIVLFLSIYIFLFPTLSSFLFFSFPSFFVSHIHLEDINPFLVLLRTHTQSDS